MLAPSEEAVRTRRRLLSHMASLADRQNADCRRSQPAVAHLPQRQESAHPGRQSPAKSNKRGQTARVDKQMNRWRCALGIISHLLNC